MVHKISCQKWSWYQLPRLRYTRTNIINLGIRRQPNQKPYRRSRDGKRLTGRIFGIVKKHQLQGKIRQVDYNNLTTITISKVPLSRRINLAHINARSVCNKKDQIQEQIVTNNMDLCAITETWIKQDDTMMAKEILPPGYSVSSSPLQGNRAGGGTALIYKDIFNVTQTATPSLTMTKCSSYGLQFGSNCIKLYIIYRQPEGSVLSCEKFATLFDNDIMDTRNPIIVGDLNIHMEDTSNADTRLFLDVLESLNLQNRVGFPTHISKHTIDLIIHDKLLCGVANVQPGHFLSDHCLIHYTLNAEKPEQPSRVISYRKLKATR